MLRRFSLLLVFWSLLLVLLSPPVLAQGCAMCRSTLTGQAASTIQALNWGVLILLIPPLAIMSGILLVTFRQDKVVSPEKSKDLTDDL